MTKKKAVAPAPVGAEVEVEDTTSPTQRFLLNPATGRVLIWTEALAQRPDLAECGVDGVPLRPIARRLARRAEEEAEAKQAATERIVAVTHTKDTFGKARNPTPPALPAVDNSDLGALDA